MTESYTYDDVLMTPKHSSVKSRKDVKLNTRLSRRVFLHNPLIAANMDTVCEAEMCIAMARNGGIGILHRFLSIEDQVYMVKRVKRAEAYVIDHPYTLLPTATVTEYHQQCKEHRVDSFVIINSDAQVIGLLTSRDVHLNECSSVEQKVGDLMTPFERLVVGEYGCSMEDALKLMAKSRVEKLPLVNKVTGKLMGMITATDVLNKLHRPWAALDSQGRLLVGAAVGVKWPETGERAKMLVEAGCDVLVVDIAHGDSDICVETVQKLKSMVGERVDIIAGNVATVEGTRNLIEAGADAVKVGVGGGSICITRIVTGCGVPQLTAVINCAQEAAMYNIPVIADGGIRNSGDAAKALAAGASTVMLGSMLAGTDESPGQVIVKQGKKVKVVRGMAGYGANLSKNQRINGDDIFDVTPEGVEGVVPYRGAVSGVISQLIGGLASAISYCGGLTIEDMQKNHTFIKITSAGIKESGAHDILLI